MSAASALDAREHSDKNLTPDLFVISDKDRVRGNDAQEHSQPQIAHNIDQGEASGDSEKNNGPEDESEDTSFDSVDLKIIDTLTSLGMNKDINETTTTEPQTTVDEKWKTTEPQTSVDEQQKNPTKQKITDYFSGTNKDNRIPADTSTLSWIKTLEKTSREQFQSGKGTLNDKISFGVKSGRYWQQTLDMEKTEETTKMNINEPGKNTDNNLPLQDTNGQALMIGADVIGLYPNLDQIGVAHITAQAIRDTKVKFKGINYMLLTIYLLLVLGPSGMNAAGLGDYIPRRKLKGESRSLNSTTLRDPSNWDFSEISYESEKDKKNMIAMMVQIMVLLLTSTTCYKFAGEVFKQKTGLGIGLRGSAALARIAMCTWDKIWGELQLRLGLSIQIWCRYVDDLRFYLRPISKGRYWSNNKWAYNDNSDDHRTPELRTAEELGKSLNDVWAFTQFTTECESEFPDNFLPTLDFATHVKENGYIRYRFFSKPMSSNNLLIKGTALSKSCIFSSLRQDLVRHLLNTDYREGIECRLEIVRKFIQLLINSDHTFQYIKSVVLQAISKYIYMVQRANLDCHNKRFCPLHRARSYQSEMRKLIKYTNHARWYTGEKVGDIYKNGWKRWIRRKGPKARRNKTPENKEPDTTTVMFVPKTKDGELLQQLQMVENKLGFMGWKTKLIEKPGIPLFTKFSKSFDMTIGCARGSKCSVCEGKGTKCCVKGVVYKAKCLGCHEKNQGVYIGETSRQFGTRVSEHINNVSKWRKESFILDHWMNQHGTDTSPPLFKFEIISKHKDALSRQLCEALHIRKQGNLNKKQEFSINELIRVQSSKYSWDRDKENREALEQEKNQEYKLSNFISVMSSVLSFEKADGANNTYSFQIKKRGRVAQQQGPSKRLRRMDMSTPVQHREPRLHNLTPSPIQGIKPLNEEHQMETSVASSNGEDGAQGDKATGISGDAQVLVVTPPKPDSPVMSVAKQSITATEHNNSKSNYKERLKRKSSVGKDYIKPATTGDITEIDTDCLSASLWDDECKFKARESDSDSLEVSEILAKDVLDPNCVKDLSDTTLGGGTPKNIIATTDENAKLLMKKATDTPGTLEDKTKPHLKAVDAFGETVADDLRVKEIIEQKTKNKLYETFIKTPTRISTESGRIISGLMTPSKRKISPDMLQDTPSPKQTRTDRHNFISPSIGGGNSDQAGGVIPDRARPRRKITRKGKTTKPDPSQMLITDMMRDKNIQSDAKEEK